jgi:hypothetical protein
MHLQESRRTDAGVEALARLTELHELNLRYTGVTDAGLKRLPGLPQLQRVYHGENAAAGGADRLRDRTRTPAPAGKPAQRRAVRFPSEFPRRYNQEESGRTSEASGRPPGKIHARMGLQE